MQLPLSAFGSSPPWTARVAVNVDRRELPLQRRTASMQKSSTEKASLLAYYTPASAAEPQSSPARRRSSPSTALRLVAIAALTWLAASKAWHGWMHSPPELVASSVPWKTEPFNPTSIPLAARSPYNNVWLESGNRARRGLLTSQYGDYRPTAIIAISLIASSAAAFNGNWLPWLVGALVDGRPFTLMSTPGVENGLDGPAGEQLSMSFTTSSTTFVMRAGPVDLTLEFLSPIVPEDLLRQTLPYTYLSISAMSNDGNSHAVQIHTDIDAKFVSNNWDAQCEWNTTVQEGLIYHQVFLKDQVPYGEFDDL